MKAIRVHSYGGPETLRFEDAPRPEPSTGEVLIRVHAAGVNPIDWKIREGLRPVARSLPFIPGWDVSGTVEAAGPGAGRFKMGDHVMSRPDIARDGAYAEYIVVRETEVASKPKSIDHLHAASIPLAATTAWQVLFDVGGLSAGQRVLIHGAAGSVGGFAVQLAKWKGAHVIGTASGRDQSFLRELGVDEPIDYNMTRFEDAVHGVDAVFDTVGGETQSRSFGVLKRGGILVSIVSPPSQEEATRLGVRASHLFMQPNSAELAEIAALVDAETVKTFVGTVLPLAEARKAHELSERGHSRGKIVFKVV